MRDRRDWHHCFLHVVPFLRGRTTRSSRSRSGAKVEIGRNDFQGADLPRRLLHRSVPEMRRTVQFQQYKVLRDHSQPPL